MGLIDTHTHLATFAQRGDLPAIRRRAAEAGLEAMITIGTDTDDWSLYRDLAAEQADGPAIHYTVGLHPCSVGEDWAERVAQVPGFWDGKAAGRAPRAPAPVALGEIGLDRFHLPKDPAEAARIFGWQQAAFARGLEMARGLGCPVVVHSRGAFRECVEMVDGSGVAWDRVVFHCFTEGPAEMAELTRRGGFGSFTGIVTYKTAAAIREAAQAQGLERLMIETDAPYLTPMPHRGKPNEPAYLRHTAECCASLFNVSLDALTRQTTANARRFFGI
ncbi:MAG: TatD family hydrolase [Opitutaceae bacterium]|nr:TatD family hydrolase [Opitutaceae bacterium]